VVTERVQIRVLAMLLGATTFAAVDQWVKLFVTTPVWAYHHRSEGWFLGSCVLFVCMAALALLPSIGVAIGAALFAGGLLGNMMSASADHFYVPNPLLVGHTDGVAFNVADVCILSGNVVLVVACCALAIRNRDRLDTWRAGAHARLRSRS
jgi:lipoprotein signal peptidase